MLLSHLSDAAAASRRRAGQCPFIMENKAAVRPVARHQATTAAMAVDSLSKNQLLNLKPEEIETIGEWAFLVVI